MTEENEDAVLGNDGNTSKGGITSTSNFYDPNEMSPDYSGGSSN